MGDGDKLDLCLAAEASAFRKRATETDDAELRQGFQNIASILDYLAVKIDTNKQGNKR